MSHMKGNVTHEGERRTCSECNPDGWKKERQADWELHKKNHYASGYLPPDLAEVVVSERKEKLSKE